MHHDLEVFADAEDVASAGAAFVAERARAAVSDHGRFTFAVSGGHTPWAMFAELAHEDLPWEHVVIYQVDERVAPPDDPDRNLAHLYAALGAGSFSGEGSLARTSAPPALPGVRPRDPLHRKTAALVFPMPVDDADLDAAAARYADGLPERFDLVHLGLGPDGHTASLVPGDPVLDVSDRLVAVTRGTYHGRRRMTLTYPGLARADQLLWLVTGTDKAAPLRRLIEGDTSIPAGRVRASASRVLADRAARP